MNEQFTLMYDYSQWIVMVQTHPGNTPYELGRYDTLESVIAFIQTRTGQRVLIPITLV